MGGMAAAIAKKIIRVLMADDHEIFRDGVRKLLEGEDDIQIVGEASNGNGGCPHAHQA